MSKSFPIPTAALDQHIALLGKTGSGKTYSAKGIVEHLLDHKRQVCVLDPTAAWWGLRLGSDGKSEGYKVVLLGGKHADLPLSEMSGSVVARLVTEQGASVVIDTSGMTVGEYTRWFIDFAGTLYTTIKNPLHLVIDEAHYFMPQARTLSVDGGKMLHNGNRLISGGRSLGIRAVMITQRPAKFHKDSLTQADTLIAMRLIAPQDRAAVKEWIDGMGDPGKGKAVLESLAGLKRGDGWVWYPEGGYLDLVTFPKIKTYDSSATPKHGARSGPVVSEIDLEKAKSAMAEAVKEAEANDPKLLRKQIAELRKQLAGQKPVADDGAVSRAVDRAVAARDKEWDQRVRSIQKAADGYAGRLRKIGELASLNGEAVVEVPVRPALAQRPIQRRATPVRHHADTSGERLPIGEQKVLTACAQYPDGLDRSQMTVLTGYKRSTRDAYIQRLREKGYVDDSRGLVVATETGVAALGDFEPLPSGEDLRSYWLDRLPVGERAVLECLVNAYPEPVEREAITEATGYQRSTRDAYIQRMKAKAIVEIVGRGAVKASDNLFDGASA